MITIHLQVIPTLLALGIATAIVLVLWAVDEGHLGPGDDTTF